MRALLYTVLFFCSRLFLCSGAALAGGPWDALAGRWTGEGDVSGMTAAVALVFRPTLGGQGHHLSFENHMRGEDGQEWLFRAEALYLCAADGSCRGHWYDSRGTVLPLRTVSESDRVVVEWGDAATERGRTTYRLLPDGGLEITDEVTGQDTTWSVFGKTLARRVE
jgi:hypothetical protein